MKRLNNRGISIIEIIVTFSLVMVIVGGLMSIIMHYRLTAQSSLKQMELQSYKETLTKAIQDDILDLGIAEINYAGNCNASANQNRFSSCANLVFKDGTEKILAVSNMFPDDRNSLENKYIYYDNERYTLKDSLPPKIPSGRHAIDFQTVFINTDNFVSSESVSMPDGSETKIYSIDISIEHIDYNEDYGIHIVTSTADFLSTNALVTAFSYTGGSQVFTAPSDGTYKIELWGASGGDIGPYKGGQGSYTSGYISLRKNQQLHVYVGGQGTNTDVGGFNGGDSLIAGQSAYGASGGGATDVRIVGGSWNDFNSLKSRIMVAAGGGGANYRNVSSDSDGVLYGSGNGGSGGGLVGYEGKSESYTTNAGTGYVSHNSHGIGSGATQTIGGTYRTFNSSNTVLNSTITGGFGTMKATPNQSGGGGGWYTGSYSAHGGAGGGSSYISGHIGCRAINQSSTASALSHKPTSEYADFIFSNTTMIDGQGYQWTTATTPTSKMPMPYNGVTTIEEGNVGNGYAQITYLGL